MAPATHNVEEELSLLRNLSIDKSHRLENVKAVENYTRDYTELARKNSFDPALGRSSAIRLVIEALSRRKKPNVILLGDPGVGKTALVEGLAQRIVAGNVPDSLVRTRILEVDMGSIRGGATYHGEYEGRVKALLNEVEELIDAGNKIILFIDEIHLLMSGQGYRRNSTEMDAANLFKPALARGKFSCIGATTVEEYETFVKPDQALVRRFACVHIQEMSVKGTETILRGLRSAYQDHHAVNIMDSAIVKAAALAKQYLPNGRLPDAAITLIDDACVSIVMSRQIGPRELDVHGTAVEALECEINSLEQENDPASASRLSVAQRQLKVARKNLQLAKKRYEESKTRAQRIVLARGNIYNLRTALACGRQNGEVDMVEFWEAMLQEEHNRLSELIAGGDPTSVTPDVIVELVQSRLSQTHSERLLKVSLYTNSLLSIDVLHGFRIDSSQILMTDLITNATRLRCR